MNATVPRRIRPFPYDRLARVAHGQVEAGRALSAHLPLVDEVAFLEAGARLGGAVSVRLVETYAFPVRDLYSRLPGPPSPALLRIAGPAGRAALLSLDATLALRIARRYLSLAGFQSGPPGELPGLPILGIDEQRALAALLDPLLLDVPARVDGFPLDDAELSPLFPDPYIFAADALVRTPVGEGFARLLVPERLRVEAPLPRRLSALLERRARLEGARVALIMEVGRTRLSRDELAGLAPGDVVLFDEFGPRPPFGGPLRLRLGRGAIQAHLDGEGLTVVKGFELGATTMDSPKVDDTVDGLRDDGTTDALLRELPVEMVCELGRVSVTGRELLELGPGAVIPIGRPLAGPVDLTVGGRVVARGELVDVEGEIGVRVTQVHR